MQVADASHRPGLLRSLGLWSAIAINVANMIGTGVFLKARVMTCNVGSAWLVLAVWLAAGLLALAGTFAYAEVAVLMPEAGGEYVYVRRAYGRLVGFLNGWVTFAVARCGGQAAVAAGLAIFLNDALGGVLAHDVLHLTLAGISLHLSGLVLVALAAIWVVGLINCRPVATGGHAALLLTILKVLLVLGVAVGAFAFASGSFSHLALDPGAARCEGVAAGARGGLGGFAAAMLGALWAYDGWNNVAPVAGEVRDPSRNLPRAFVGATMLVGTLYLLANLAYFYVLTPAEIANLPASGSVAAEVVRRFIGPAALTLMAAGMMMSSFGALHASMLAGARVPFAMARDGLFFRWFGALSARGRVPVRAALAQSAIASLLALSGSYDALTDSVIFAEWLFYGLALASVFVFRRTMPDAPRPYRAFGYPWVAAAAVAATLWLLFNTLVSAPRPALLGAVLMVAGLPVYWWMTRRAPLTPPSPRAGR